MIRTGSIWKQFEDAIGGEKILLVLERIEIQPDILLNNFYYSCLTSSGRVISLYGDFLFKNFYYELRL